MTTNTFRFVFKRDQPIEWENFSDLSGKTIILNKSYTYPNEFLDAIKYHDIVAYETFKEGQNLQLLLRGRGDLTILEEKAIDHYMNELAPDDQAYLFVDDEVVFETTGYLLFTRREEKRAEALASVLMLE